MVLSLRAPLSNAHVHKRYSPEAEYIVNYDNGMFSIDCTSLSDSVSVDYRWTSQLTT